MYKDLPNIVTRYISVKAHFCEEDMTVHDAAFISRPNYKYKEISVVDIDDELRTNNNLAIYKIGDKLIHKGKPHTVARADIEVSRIKTIKYTHSDSIYLDYTGEKHCNIKPFLDDGSELHIANKLAEISSLHIRN